jgi:hypothetical protein
LDLGSNSISAGGECFNAVAEFRYGTGNFVSGRQRPRDVRKSTMDEFTVGTADDARMHLDTDMTGRWRGRLDLDQL